MNLCHLAEAVFLLFSESHFQKYASLDSQLSMWEAEKNQRYRQWENNHYFWHWKFTSRETTPCLILQILKIIRNMQYPRRNGLLCVSGHISSLVSFMCFGISTKEKKSAFPLILQRFLFSTLNPSNPFKLVSGKGAGVYPGHPSHCWPELMGKHKMSAAVQAVHHF